MRRRILALVVGMTTLVVLAFAVPVGVVLRSAIEQRAEQAAIDQANTVAVYLSTGTPTKAAITDYVTRLSESSGRPTSVQLTDGSTVGPVPSSLVGLQGGPGPGGDNHGGPGPGGNGGDIDPHATLRSVPSGQFADAVARGAAGSYVVHVFLSNSKLHDGEGQWWALLIGGSLGLLAIGVVAGELITRRIVRPLVRTAHTANDLSRGEIGARAPTEGPREIAEVGVALNRLADRIDELIAEERETAADVSHRLRTPLTALRLDAEALRDSDEAERIGEHVSALERTLTAVIHAARRPQREGRMPSCDATAVVGERVEFWSALAEDQNRTSSIVLPDAPLLVRSSADDLAAALDALLENVFAHTPEGTPFSVVLAATDEGARLTVADEGPGLAEDAEVRGRSDRGSSGLGLDIARRSAQASGGTFALGATPGGGALITLTFGAP